MHPHDGCVANKLENGKHQTSCWHANNLKVSNADPKVNNNFVEKLRKKYEKNQKGSMKVTRGKIHTCLGILFDFSCMRQVKIIMLDCIMEPLKGKEAPAQDWLF